MAGSGDGGEGHTYSFVNRGASRRTQQSVRPKGSLIAVAGEQAGRRYAIGDGVVIGRSDDADIALTDPDVSRAHARVTRVLGDTFVVEDLGSRNGTFVDDQPVDERVAAAFGSHIRIGASAILTIARRDPADDELGQRQRLETLGRIGAGVAHDINNMLNAILGTASYMEDRLAVGALDEQELRDCVREVLLAARRAAELTPRMVAFARGSSEGHAEVNLSKLCGEVVDLARRTFPRAIEVQASVEEGLLARGDAGELYQLLLNLCLNARDAMTDGGLITVRARVSKSEHAPNAKPTIVLTVSDTGPGMDAETRERAFEPFSSSAEGGSGLGLAAARAICEAHGGKISVNSEPGRGTVFHVRLPAAAAARMHRTPPHQRGPMAVAASGLSVAVVDDEELVRNALGRTLSFAGYRVIALGTGDALVEQYRAGLRADLVVLDMDMPGRDGHATLVALNEIDPEVRAIMVSGHPYDGRAEETLRLGAVSYLQKPCDGRALTEAVDAALHAARRPRRRLQDTIGSSAKDTERPRRKP